MVVKEIQKWKHNLFSISKSYFDKILKKKTLLWWNNVKMIFIYIS